MQLVVRNLHLRTNTIVTTAKLYFIVVRSLGPCNWMGEQTGTYVDGAMWVNEAPTLSDMGMITYGTNVENFPCSKKGYLASTSCNTNGTLAYSSTICSWSQFSEFTIVQPSTSIQLCNVDILEREAFLANVTIEFAIYESVSSSMTSLYNK